MLFVSETFLLYFIVVFVFYWLTPVRFRLAFLLVVSLFFYATWNLKFTLHFILVVSVNYSVMEIWRIYPKRWIFFSLQIANLLNLAFFKYFYFVADIIGNISGIEALKDPQLKSAHVLYGQAILLPLAISFYTFQIMAYGIDIYKGVYVKRHSFFEVLLFKAFFPQLIAGPIMRSSELLPQISECYSGKGLSVDRSGVYRGFWLILIGIVKKMFIADILLQSLAPYLSLDAEGIQRASVLELWLALFSLVLMLYADFSAYTDLARGTGALLGFHIPRNFHAPLFMTSISDFWRRWHLTFSLWLRDYVFIPLGGSRKSESRTYVNFIVIFTLGGLWHGASWNFVLWGAITGVFVCLESYAERRGWSNWPKNHLLKGPRLLLTWLCFTPVMVFFFAPNMAWAGNVFLKVFSLPTIFTEHQSPPSFWPALLTGVLLSLLFHFLEEVPQKFQFLRTYESKLLPAAAIIVIFAATQFSGGPKDFFYFQF